MRLLGVSALLACGFGRVVDFEADGGAVPDDSSLSVEQLNGGILNATLAALSPGDTLVVPNRTYHVMGGVLAEGLQDVVLRIDGTLAFSESLDDWPFPYASKPEKPADCLTLVDIENVTITSAGRGTLDGRGSEWWGAPGLGYLWRGENRPMLLRIDTAKSILVENLLLQDSPYWTFWATDVDGLEVRYTDIDARRTTLDGHTAVDLTAYNTDGFDVSGRNVWIHDCNIWNQDDCIGVKRNAENMLFERINASGLGLTIGSIGLHEPVLVRNITFRQCRMRKTVKGIYLKFNGNAKKNEAVIQDVLYEDIIIDEPSQYAIWIGPAQQLGGKDLWHGDPCALSWPQLFGSTCEAPKKGLFANITLRNVEVTNAKGSPGLLFGNAKNPMQGVVFDSVRFHNPGSSPWGRNYYCKGVHSGVATGSTWPVPKCFKDQTKSDLTHPAQDVVV